METIILHHNLLSELNTLSISELTHIAAFAGKGISDRFNSDKADLYKRLAILQIKTSLRKKTPEIEF